MYALSHEDKSQILGSSSKPKVIVPLETLRSECDSEILRELFDNMLDFALRYTESVCRWQRLAVENSGTFDEHGTRQAIEDTRHTVHNAFNDHVNILSRTMSRHGKSTKWRELIGHDRSAIGRFALTISFEYIKKSEGGGAS